MRNRLMKTVSALLLCTTLAACNNTTSTTTTATPLPTVAPTPTPYAEMVDAENLLNQLKEVNTNVGTIIVYTAETDANQLLGRPGYYTSKASFEDLRIEQYDVANDPKGGTVEVFENTEDGDSRYEYLSSMQDPSLGAFGVNQYIYKYDKAIFRISYDITPDEAEVYHSAIDAIMSQYQPVEEN